MGAAVYVCFGGSFFVLKAKQFPCDGMLDYFFKV